MAHAFGEYGSRTMRNRTLRSGLAFLRLVIPWGQGDILQVIQLLGLPLYCMRQIDQPLHPRATSTSTSKSHETRFGRFLQAPLSPINPLGADPSLCATNLAIVALELTSAHVGVRLYHRPHTLSDFFALGQAVYQSKHVVSHTQKEQSSRPSHNFRVKPNCVRFSLSVVDCGIPLPITLKVPGIIRTRSIVDWFLVVEYRKWSRARRRYTTDSKWHTRVFPVPAGRWMTSLHHMEMGAKEEHVPLCVAEFEMRNVLEWAHDVHHHFGVPIDTRGFILLSCNTIKCVGVRLRLTLSFSFGIPETRAIFRSQNDGGENGRLGDSLSALRETWKA